MSDKQKPLVEKPKPKVTPPQSVHVQNNDHKVGKVTTIIKQKPK